jgi:Flp pilus assembly protein TadG
VHAKLRHAQRGQAIVETVIFLPMFLLALFGIMWAVQAAVQYERVESAVRYAGLVTQRQNPYADFSMYSMYAQVNSAVIPTLTCVIPLTTPLSDAAPTYASAQTVTASSPFWTPSSPAATCPYAALIGLPAGTGLVQDVIIGLQEPSVTSNVTVNGPLANTLGALTSSRAGAYFFTQIGVNTIMACYANLNKQVALSLDYTTDPASAVAPTALGSTVTPIALVPSSSCTTL